MKMSVTQCCRLCCTACNDYVFLQNEAGDNNEIYEIAAKYYQLLLTEEENPKDGQNVLCNNCWQHISDFHEFQSAVLLINSVEKCDTISQMETVVKQEFIEEHTVAEDKNKDQQNFDCEKNYDKDYVGFSDDNFLINDDDYEKPLITLKKPMKKQMQIDEDKIKEQTNFEKQLKSFSIQVKQEDQSDIVTSNPLSEDSRNKETLFEDDYLEIENFKMQSPPSFDSIPIKSFNEEKLVHNQIENSEELEVAHKIKDAVENESSKKIIKSLEVEVDSKHKGTKEKGSLPPKLQKSKEYDAFIAEWKPELVCDLCTKTANNYCELRNHFIENHKTKFYIKCCEKKFFRRSVLVYHIQLHLNPETHKCDICGKSSTTKSSLKVHKKMVHEDIKQFKCDICEKPFKQKDTLERHLLTHVTGNKDFICSECGKGFVVEQLLKWHIRQVHNIDPVCNQCGKTIHGYRALKKHLMEHAGSDRRKFACDECGLELKSGHGLKLHKASYHNDGSTIYVCRLCGKVAASENALRSHKKLMHNMERNHKCTYCEKAFKRPISLREHITTHTGQDIYQCPHCPKTFKFSDRLFQHRKKFHPVEWEEKRKNRLQHPKIDTSKEKKQIVIC